MTTLAEILSSKVRAELFRLLFGVGTKDLHLRELQRQSGLAVGTVRQEAGKLVRLGLITRRVDGNRVYYQANGSHPLFPEICGMVGKTAGLAGVLKKSLQHKGIKSAFLFGSLAGGQEKADSDVDLIVIGGIGLRQVTRLLSGLSGRLGREINPHVFTVEEFRRRRLRKEHFVSSVLSSTKIFIIGSHDELEGMAE